jgi:hypothetical protein
MGLNVKKLPNGLYLASATPPHVDRPWILDKASPAREVFNELRKQGCHPQDIGDALYEQDPNWVDKL